MPKPKRPASQNSDTWLYGTHTVRAALANPKRKLRRLFAKPPIAKDIAQLAAKRRLRIEPWPQGRQTSAIVHQGLMLHCAALVQPSLPAVARSGKPIVLLDNVTDVRNVGAILRTSAYFGVGAVVLPMRHSAQQTAALAKAASGALETVALISMPKLTQALQLLKQAGYISIGLDANAQQELQASHPPKQAKLACVLGAEDKGLRAPTRAQCMQLRRLGPLRQGGNTVESLNVSVAAAIALYIYTQRSAPIG